MDACTAQCGREAAAMCPNDAPEDCTNGCELIARLTECRSTSEAFFACAETAMVTCDADGEATVTGCEVQQAAAAVCVLDALADPAFAEPCAAYCAQTATAMCENEPPASECTLGCQVAPGLVPACASLYSTYLDCASTAEYTCSAEGEATSSGCASQALGFFGCLLASGGGLPPMP
jgi:hypothetical protein